MSEANTGRFVWYELMTTDPKAAIPFYTDVVGWTTQEFPAQEAGKEPYTMWVSSQGPLGGTMALPEEAKKMGAPPHWLSYVGVANVDASVTKAKGLGAKVYVEPMDIPTIGRFAVIADPQGAVIAVFTPTQAMAAHDDTKAGEFTWHELMTSDSAAGFTFYSEMFGWQKLDEHDMGPMGKYVIYGREGKALGGMMTKPPGAPMPSAWMYYIHTDDLEAAIERAKAKGATVMNGPMDVPGGTRIAQLMDPQGAAFALHAPGAKAAA